MKNILLIATILLLSTTLNAQKKDKTYKVLTACGQCQFDMNSPTGCALAIQLAGKKYWVDGSTISDHGDEHADDGLCKKVRKAKVQGTFKGKRFESSSFVLISKKKKKKKK
ncbi:MAG: hypothetical protein JKX68_04780 [Flavobacteriales bacterium]|nr:hypothetical protein [Flavobacteriales bacterium]